MSEESDFFRIDMWQQKLNEERERTAKWKAGYKKAMDMLNDVAEEKNKAVLENRSAQEQLKDLRDKIDQLEHKVTNAFDQMDV